MRSADDLTARSRLRDAALVRFARDGFGTPLRAIAADAGVSPALVVHHFGSKDGLRAACDEHVLAIVGEELASLLRNATPRETIARITQALDLGPVVAYLVRSLLTGGELAARLVDGLVRASEDYLREGVANGSVRPDADVPGMARVLVAVDMGLLLQAQVRASAGDGPALTEDPAAAMAAMAGDVRAVLELYTRGVLTDTSYLDAYVATLDDGATPDPTLPQEET